MRRSCPGSRPGRLTPYRGTAFSLSVVETFTIGRLADLAGVNVETVRYYERRRLLRQPPRSPGGYRQYSAVDLARLQFIARAKQLGFTLTEVASLVGDPETKQGADSVLRLARAKITALTAQQLAVEQTRTRLMQLIDICEDPTSQDCVALRTSR
jgi:DNA-binding transcriptional MerR regulator